MAYLYPITENEARRTVIWIVVKVKIILFTKTEEYTLYSIGHNIAKYFLPSPKDLRKKFEKTPKQRPIFFLKIALLWKLQSTTSVTIF